MANEEPKRRRGRWWKVALGVVVLAVVLPALALPLWLNSGAGRSWLLSRANQALAPGRLDAASFHFSWFGPTRMSGLVLIDPQGVRAIDSPRVRWDRSLGQLLWAAPRFGTLVLEGAALDVRREADGTINLYQTLKPILRGDPRLDLNVVVERGRLRLQSAEFPEAIVAEKVDARVDLASAPRPLTWRVDLAQAAGADGGGTLLIEGSYDRWNKTRGGTSDLALRATANGWSYAVAGADLSLRGRVDGSTSAERRDGRWASSANGAVADFEVFGARLGDTRLRWDQVSAACDVSETAGTWSVGRLDLTAPIGALHARGSFDPSKGTLALAPLSNGTEKDAIHLAGAGLKISGLGSTRGLHAEAAFGGDLARLAQLVAPEVRSVHGTWSGRASAAAAEEGLQVTARLEARDLSDDVEGPIALSLDALAVRDSDRVELKQLALTSEYATIQAAGGLNIGKGDRKLVLRGSVAPGWDAINRLAARRIDPRAQVAGKPGALSFEADLSDLSARRLRESLAGEAGFELTGANFFGMRVGATPVVLRMGRGELSVAPIDTTINEGRLHIEPRLSLDGETGPALVLGPESSVRDAAINDEVSHRVLSFVAPVLESATRVRGRVSVALEDAEFPLGGSADRHASVDGTVTFHDVEFVAGQLVDDLMAVIGREPKASLKLNKPVSLVIADGRVETKGVALPLGDVTEIALDGWVDFDRRMNITASLPVTRKMVLGVDFLGDIVAGTKIGLPIRGTLDHPEIDRDALRLGMKELGKTLLERTAGRSAAELLMRLARPPDPNAPRRLTPAERRARRMERRLRRNGALPPGNEP